MSLDYRKAVYIPRRRPVRQRTTYGIMTEWAKRDQSPEVPPSPNPRFPPLNLSRSFDEPPGENSRLKSSRQSQYMAYSSNSARDRHLGGVTSYGHRPFKSREMPSSGHGARTHRPTSGSLDTPRSQPPTKHHSLDIHDDSFGKLHPLGQPNMLPMYGTPRQRSGCLGGSWRHVREVLQAGGSRTVYINGEPRLMDHLNMGDSYLPFGKPKHPPWRATHAPAPYKVTAQRLENRATEGINWRIMR